MKKIYFIIFIVLCGVVAQAQKTKSYTSGIKAGANFYTISTDEDDDDVVKNSRLHFHAGILFNFPITSMFSIQPEFLYSGEGVKVENDEAETETRLQFLNAPVMLQFNTTSGFYIEAGPQLCILFQAKARTTSDGGETNQDIESALRKAVISVGGGLGFKKSHFGVGARYNYGLTRLQKTLLEGESEMKSSGFQFSLMYFFNQER
jgi:hypothetical protein